MRFIVYYRANIMRKSVTLISLFAILHKKSDKCKVALII